MQVFARRVECKHILWGGAVVDTSALVNLADGLRGLSCPTCGEIVAKVDFMAITKPTSTFDEPPAPRHTANQLKNQSHADLQKTQQRLEGLGAEVGGLAADLKEAALGLAPSRWRGALAKIPVGILQTYEPNAECIRFSGSLVPAIVFHQGLAGFLFKMNRSIFPLARMGTLRGDEFSFVEDEQTRLALRVQAVDTALEFLGIGRPRSKVLVEVPEITMVLEMPLTRTMAAFVLCHEYGHAVLNHADEPLSVGGDYSESYLLERSRSMEFEADAWGQDAVIGAFTDGKNLEPSLAVLDAFFSDGAPEMKQDISHIAPCVTLLYFEFLDVIEELISRHDIGVAGQDALTRRRARRGSRSMTEHGTHPSNKERFQFLHAHLSEHGNFTAHSWVAGFEMLLNEIKEDLAELIDRTGAVTGKRLVPRFQWPWSTMKRKPASWRNSITRFESDSERSAVEAALQSLEGGAQELTLDAASLRSHTESQKRKAEAHYRKKEYGEAVRICTQLLEAGETKESVTLYPLLAKCWEGLGDSWGAIAAYRRFLKIVPDGDAAAESRYSLDRLLRAVRGG